LGRRRAVKKEDKSSRMKGNTKTHEVMERGFQTRDTGDRKSLLTINSKGHACDCWNPDESKGDSHLRESQKRI